MEVVLKILHEQTLPHVEEMINVNNLWLNEMPMEENINLKKIAQICGVSVTTVSRVINQNGRFSLETGEKVRKVIEEYGYRPNQIAKGLRTSKMDVVAIIVPDITNEFFSLVVQSLQKRLFSDGYTCLIFNTDESREIELQCVDKLRALNVSCVVSVCSHLHQAERLSLDIPSIYVDRKPEAFTESEKAIFLFSNHEEGAYQAGRELALCGCQKVACITGLRDATYTKMRNAGFMRACEQYGMELPPELIFVPREASFQCGYDVVEKILKEGKVFDGIFCQTDWLAIGALTSLLDHGVDVPGQVQVIGFDDITAAGIARKPLTTVRQHPTQIGVRVAELVISIMNGRPIEQREIVVPVELIRRSTTVLRNNASI